MPNAEIHIHDTYVRVNTPPLLLIAGIAIAVAVVVVAILLCQRALRRKRDREALDRGSREK